MNKSNASAKRVESYWHKVRFSNPSESWLKTPQTEIRRESTAPSSKKKPHLQNKGSYEMIPDFYLCDKCNDMNGFDFGHHNRDTHKTDQDQIVIEVQAACKITISVSESTRVKIESLLPTSHSGKSPSDRF